MKNLINEVLQDHERMKSAFPGDPPNQVKLARACKILMDGMEGKFLLSDTDIEQLLEAAKKELE